MAMNTDSPNSNRSIPGFVRPLIVLVCVGVSLVLPTLISGALLYSSFAIILLTAAIVIPIREKHISFYSVFLAISAILFVLSAVMNYAYHNVGTRLPILKQIEFSIIMQPEQVSFGLSFLGIGTLQFLLMLVAWVRSRKLSEKSIKPKIVVWAMAISGIYCSVAGIVLIVEGLSRL